MNNDIVNLSSLSIEDVRKKMATMDQVECPVNHHFSDGLYTRETSMPKGTFAIGKKHKYAVTNILLKGKISVFMGEDVEVFEAPCIFVSKPGVSKIAFFHQDTVWLNCHPTNETDLDEIEKLVIIPDDSNEILEIQGDL